MNILMIHPHDLYSPSEPWTTRIKNIAHQFAKNGHCVKLAYFALNRDDAGKERLDNGVETISLRRNLGVFILLANIARITRLAEWADIIHFQKCYYYAALPALIAAWIKNKPLHYDWDDWETKIFYYSNPRQVIVGEFINIFERLTPRAVDTVSVSSERLRRLCLKRGVRPQNIFMAPVGADLELFKPGANSPGKIKRKYNIHNHLILYLGQLHGGQYAELFIKSAALIADRGDATFMIVGDGYRLASLKELAREAGVEKRFIFTGYVAHEEVPSYINDADICVACFEDNDITTCKSPLKVVEYLACGKAIIASNAGEVGDMVGNAGVLINPGDAASLANSVVSLIADKGLREKLGKLARERAENKYNWSTTADSLLGAYKIALHFHRKDE